MKVHFRSIKGVRQPICIEYTSEQGKVRAKKWFFGATSKCTALKISRGITTQSGQCGDVFREHSGETHQQKVDEAFKTLPGVNQDPLGTRADQVAICSLQGVL